MKNNVIRPNLIYALLWSTKGFFLYMLVYMIMTAGVFAIVMCMCRQGRAVYKISDLSGLSKTAPGLAYALAILMFSMSGIPPAAGFFSKMIIFNAAVAEEHYVLAVLGVLASVVAAYYYLKIIKTMFFDEAADAFDKDVPFVRRVVLCISVFFVIAFVVKPSVFINSSISAASALFVK